MKLNDLPWQDADWRDILSRVRAGRLPHGLLLAGPAGIGKVAFGERLAHWLLCESAERADHPCGQCAACHLWAAGTHPDFYRVRPELLALAEGAAAEAETDADAGDAGGDDSVSSKKKASREVTVDQIRRLTQRLQLGAMRGGMRVALIYPADAMNAIAANALLKTLEEPWPGVVFILCSDHAHQLLPTIVSRCHRIDMPVPPSALARAWLHARAPELVDRLALVGGAPLALLRAAGTDHWRTHDAFIEALKRGSALDPIGVARVLDADIKKADREAQGGQPRSCALSDIVTWLQRWLADAVGLRLSGALRYYPKEREALERLGQRGTIELFALAKWLTTARLQADHPVNIQLFLEDVLLRYRALFDERN